MKLLVELKPHGGEPANYVDLFVQKMRDLGVEKDYPAMSLESVGHGKSREKKHLRSRPAMSFPFNSVALKRIRSTSLRLKTFLIRRIW